jgi:WD40 repeat protein
MHQVVLRAHAAPVAAVVWSPDGSLLATASHDHTVRLWCAKTLEEKRRLTGRSAAVRGLDWSPDSTRLVSVDDRGVMRVWSVETGEITMSVAAHPRRAVSVAWSPDGTRIATGGADRTARVWDAESGAPLRSMDGRSRITGVSWASSGTPDLFVSEEDGACAWDSGTGRRVSAYDQETAFVGGDGLVVPLGVESRSFRNEAYALSPCGELLASVNQEGVVCARRLREDRVTLCVHMSHTTRAECISWSPCGNRLAVAVDGNNVVVIRGIYDAPHPVVYRMRKALDDMAVLPHELDRLVLDYLSGFPR